MSSFIPPDGQPTHRRPNKWRGSCTRQFIFQPPANLQTVPASGATCNALGPSPRLCGPLSLFVDSSGIFFWCFCVRFVCALYALCTAIVGSCVRPVAVIWSFAAASHDSTGPGGTKTSVARGASDSVLLVAVIAETRDCKRHYDRNTVPDGD